MTRREAALARGVVDLTAFVLSNRPSRKAKPIENEPMRQTMLLSGLDCLPEQTDFLEDETDAD